jgi:hypothetical protein
MKTSTVRQPTTQKKEGGEEVETDIDRLTGIAMGCMGMSMTDFCSCTPSQFREAYNVWAERERTGLRQQWEQSRMMCMCMLQPYSKKRLQPRDVMRFPWDETPAKSAERKESRPREELSDEERMERYRKAARRYGYKGIGDGNRNDQVF